MLEGLRIKCRGDIIASVGLRWCVLVGRTVGLLESFESLHSPLSISVGSQAKRSNSNFRGSGRDAAVYKSFVTHPLHPWLLHTSARCLPRSQSVHILFHPSSFTNLNIPYTVHACRKLCPLLDDFRATRHIYFQRLPWVHHTSNVRDGVHHGMRQCDL